MNHTAVMIQFVEPDQGKASRYAQELEELLRAKEPRLEISRVRADPEALDAGAILSVVAPVLFHLGPPLLAAILVEVGLAFWKMHKQEKPRLQFTTPDGTVVDIQPDTPDLAQKLEKGFPKPSTPINKSPGSPLAPPAEKDSAP